MSDSLVVLAGCSSDGPVPPLTTEVGLNEEVPYRASPSDRISLGGGRGAAYGLEAFLADILLRVGLYGSCTDGS